jgi:hypothetical protein
MSAFRFIWLGCKKATFLMSKKEEGRLTVIESIQLKLHLRICDFCTRFQKQAKFFTANAPHTHEHLHISMSDEKKQAIKKQLKD